MNPQFKIQAEPLVMDNMAKAIAEAVKASGAGEVPLTYAMAYEFRLVFKVVNPELLVVYQTRLVEVEIPVQ